MARPLKDTATPVSSTSYCVSCFSLGTNAVFDLQTFCRTISRPTRVDEYGNVWQYHSRSDHHSKIACCLIMLSLLRRSTLLARHASEGKIAFGINHEMRVFSTNRKKNLDLVVCSPAAHGSVRSYDLRDLCSHARLELTAEEEAVFLTLPVLSRAPVGNVLIALEAKACMTAHQKALPRLFDELNSSHATVHGASENAIAVGFVCINASDSFVSPDRNRFPLALGARISRHTQPRAVEMTIDKVRQIPRRLRRDQEGFDALGISVIRCRNDGSAIQPFDDFPAPSTSDVEHFDRMIDRVGDVYAARFADL
jgi:hypothetical protein